MSEFHYVRTTGPDGGVDVAEGRAIGVDLEAILAFGMPPFNVAIEILSGLSEVLSIMAEDDVVHGSIDLQNVFVDETGAVSVEGFGGTRTNAPEGRLHGPSTDLYGLGRLAFTLLCARPLPDLPPNEEDHENTAIDAILAVDFEDLHEDVVSDLQWYLARLMAWEPGDRPKAIEAWRAFDRMLDTVRGPTFADWCDEAMEGGGERRDQPLPLFGLETTNRSAGPLGKGAVNFDGESLPDAGSTASWTRGGMKKALQRVLSSDYLEDPDTDWMPGTPIPPMDRDVLPNRRLPVPRRAPGEGQRRRRPPEDPLDKPLASDFDVTGGVDTPPPSVPRPRRPARKQSYAPSPVPAAPPKDPDTAPVLVQRPRRGGRAESSAPPSPPVSAPPPTPAAPPQEPVPSPPSEVPTRAMHEPIPEYVPRGPDPFADVEEPKDDSSKMLLAMIGVFVLVATLFCFGVTGIGGVAALFGGSTATTTTEPTPRPPPTPVPAPEPEPEPIPVSTEPPPPITPVIEVAPVVSVQRPRPTVPVSRPKPAPTPSPTMPLPTPPLPTPPLPTPPSPSPTPAPARPFVAPTPSPTSEIPSLPPLPTDADVTQLLVPENRPEGIPLSELQQSMRAHFTAATAARNAIINGDAEGARDAAKGLEFLNPPEMLPPTWEPYLVDLRMEAWLMGNSPDIASASFKVAQIGQSCATCHEGVRAGPVVQPANVPSRTFTEREVMKRHAWAVDWMWVGLLANDQAAWSRGASELANSPFPSVILQNFPDKKFMEYEDELHAVAVSAQSALTGEQRATSFGKMLATCARCHAEYRTPR